VAILALTIIASDSLAIQFKDLCAIWVMVVWRVVFDFCVDFGWGGILERCRGYFKRILVDFIKNGGDIL
jgi:hypothetical protein